MMGTLAASLAGKKIRTFEDLYWADVEGDIENVGGVLKITTIRVKYHLRVTEDQKEARAAGFCILSEPMSGGSKCYRLHKTSG